VVIFLPSVAHPQTPTKRPELDSQPTVRYDAPDSRADTVEKEVRRARDKHYENKGPAQVEKPPVGIYPLPLNDSSLLGPGMPARLGDAIVVGKVTDGQARLTASKHQVYSEFTVEVEKTLMAKDLSVLTPTITIERWGGGVEMSDGRVLSYGTYHKRMPLTERRYIFFLQHQKDGDDFLLITAFEIRDGHIYPLDKYDDVQQYQGWDEVTLINWIGDAISREKGGQVIYILNPPPVTKAGSLGTVCRLAHIANLHFHDLRPTFGTRLGTRAWT
jgi:hypothetical protein